MNFLLRLIALEACALFAFFYIAPAAVFGVLLLYVVLLKLHDNRSYRKHLQSQRL